MPKEIRVTVNSDGTTTTDFSGYQGKACLDAAARLRELLAAYGIQSQEINFVAKPELTAIQDQQGTQPERGQRHE